MKPLVNITKSGTYNLKMIRPKDEKVWERFKYDKNSNAFARILFIDKDGNCLTKFFSSTNAKSIAITVGKFSNNFIQVDADKFKGIKVEDLFQIFEPAFGKTCKVEVEVKDAKPFNGKPQFEYVFKSIEPISAPKSSSIDF